MSHPPDKCSYQLIILAILAVALNGCPPPPPTLTGEVKPRRTADTVTIDYDFKLDGHYWNLDSVFLALPDLDTTLNNDSVIFSPEGDLTSIYPNRYQEGTERKYELRGSMNFLVDDTVAIKEYKVWMAHYHRRGIYGWRFRSDHLPAQGMFGSAGFAFFDKAVFPGSVRGATGTVSSDFELGYIVDNERLTARFFTGGQFSDTDNDDETHDKRTLWDAATIGLMYHQGKRNHLMPSPFVNFQYSRLRILDDPEEYRSNDLGIEAGVMVERKFQRLAYSYNTNHGGYHRIDFLAAFKAGPRAKMGTVYSFYHGDELKMFRMRLYFEIVIVDDGYDSMFYRDKQSFLQKSLAYGPFAPFFWLLELEDLL